MSSGSDRRAFVQFALDEGVLRFGSFVTKSGRTSPYFFNAGLFNRGRSVGRLAQFYAQALINADVSFDMMFGPAYKGIPLATATAVALASHPAMSGRDVPFAYNRKEVKDHGEGGVLVGAPLQGKVVIIDDVITAGTSVRESVDIIRAAGAEPAAVLRWIAWNARAQRVPCRLTQRCKKCKICTVYRSSVLLRSMTSWPYCENVTILLNTRTRSPLTVIVTASKLDPTISQPCASTCHESLSSLLFNKSLTC